MIDNKSETNWSHNVVFVIELLDGDGDWVEMDVTFNEDFAQQQGKEFVDVYDEVTDYRVLPIAVKYLRPENKPVLKYEEMFRYASGMYLTDRVPEGYTDWDEDKLIAFVADHMVDIFDHLDPPDVLSEIEQAAHHWYRFVFMREKLQ